MPKNISQIEFTVFDVETTGLEPESGDRIIEIAAVRLKERRESGSFHSLINPGNRPVSPAAFAVNRISQEKLKSAPLIDKVIPLF